MKYHIDILEGENWTEITLTIDGKNYYGFTQCSPEDNYSKIRGGRIAEYKAWRSYYQAKLTEYKQKIRYFEEFAHDTYVTDKYSIQRVAGKRKEIQYHINLYESRIKALTRWITT